MTIVISSINHLWCWHPMMTSSNGNIFRVTGPVCGEFTSPGEFPTQRPVTRSFDVFLDLRLNKRLSKQPWGWWFETHSWSLWRQCNAVHVTHDTVTVIHSKNNYQSNAFINTIGTTYYQQSTASWNIHPLTFTMLHTIVTINSSYIVIFFGAIN